MNFFTDNISVIIILPLITAFLCLFSYFYKFAFSNNLLNRFTILSNFIGAIFALSIFQYINTNDIQDIQHSIHTTDIANISISSGIYADKLSLLFLSIMLIITFAVQYYSVKYLPKNDKYSLYLFGVNLLNVAYICLILSSNILQTYVFWVITGVITYILINFNFEKSKTTNSARNMLFINRLGDTSFLIGIIIIIYFLTTYPIGSGENILAYSNFTEFASDFYVYLSDGWFYTACMLLFFGIIVKSCQFPLHTWLIETKEASIPVNILIQSSTMTVAGIYVAIRLLPLFELSVGVMNTILYVGLLTALLCGFFAIEQNNLKKMLAYSTSSQLGLIVTAIGLNVPFAAIIYFATHSFSKAVLLFSAGNLYKLTEEKSFNISDFKCSRKQHPILAYCYLISIVALSGLFFAGATYHEMTIRAFSCSMNITTTVIFVIVLFINAYYLFKSYFIIFEKHNNNSDFHNCDFRLNMPVILLTLFVVSLVFIPNNLFEFFDKYSDTQQTLLSVNFRNILTFITIILGAIFGLLSGIKEKSPFPEFIKKLSAKGLYISRIYNWFGDNVSYLFGNIAKNTDKYIVNGFFNLFSIITRVSAWFVSVLQNGNIQSYITYGITLILVTIGMIGIILIILRGII